MPLKHGTETAMIFFLCLLTVLAGITAAFLPPLAVSIFPWAAAFALALLYPLALYPMMQERRAEYEFRLLHFFPAAILLAWFIIDLVASFFPRWQALQSGFVWSWTLAPVMAAFVLIILFILRVIRQRQRRLMILCAVLLPFLLLSQWSERGDWDGRLASILWDGESGTGAVADGGTAGNLDPSEDATEEQWRARLRAMERRRERLQNGGDTSTASSATRSSAVTGVVSSAMISSGGSSENPSSAAASQSSAAGSAVPPPHLPSSGPEIGFIVALLGAGCSAMLHRRTIQRARNA